jgi:hypothetical protein
MFYRWLVDEDTAAQMPVERPVPHLHAITRCQVRCSDLTRVVALDRHHVPWPWVVEEQSDYFLVPGL